VAAEYSIVCLTCCFASRPDAMVIGWPGVSEDRYQLIR